MGPSHKIYLDFIGTTACTHYECPLGNVRIDEKAIDKLKKKEMIEVIGKNYEENEHSLEMHIPFIKKVFNDAEKDFKLVPLMVGKIPREKQNEYADLLLPLFMDERTLFIISSDFCHWGSRFNYQYIHGEENSIALNIKSLDHLGMSKIEQHKLTNF
jgi:MEMO1 family protein